MSRPIDPADSLVAVVNWGSIEDASQVAVWLTMEACYAESGLRRVRRVDDRQSIVEVWDEPDGNGLLDPCGPCCRPRGSR